MAWPHRYQPARRLVFDWLVLGFVLTVTAAPARAQDVPGPPESADAALTTSQDTPPEIVSLPIIAWPSSLPAPASGQVEVELVVGRDGLAQLATCDLPSEGCDALTLALLEARFRPAQRGLESVAARVRVRFALLTSAPDEASTDPSSTLGSAPIQPTPTTAPAPKFGAVARVAQLSPTVRTLELEVMREMPGAFGDPFRAIDALPGVVPIFTGLPYVFVRGAPPSATVYFFDDVPLPALFHLALGPAVVHPAMIGPIDFYPGVAPARYGRKTGGVVAGQAAHRPLKPGIHGELELRLIDLQAYLATPLGEEGRIEVGGRYGYPGLLTKLLSPGAVLQYWDYQVRFSKRVSADTTLSVMALGSFDLVGERTPTGFERGLELQFHRIDARVVSERGSLKMGYAMMGGFERSALGDDVEVTALRLAPRTWLELRAGNGRLRVGADMMATSGKVGSPARDQEGDDDDQGDSEVSEDDADEFESSNPVYRSAVGRNVIGAYAELDFPLSERWHLASGLRGDIWITGGDVQMAAEPRSVLSYRPLPELVLHVGAGLAYQPAVFLLPLPGLSDVALDRGLQRVIQTELGASQELTESWSAELKLFAHVYDGLLSFDAIDDQDVDCSAPVAPPPGAPPATDLGIMCEEADGFARSSARALGAEFLLRRSYRERVSGWLAYTLSKAWGESDGGRELTPNFDVRHVANLVLQWRISKNWHVALRGYAQSARYPFDASIADDPRERRRLPPFARGDLQIARLWKPRFGEVRFTFDWLNFTFQREPVSWECLPNEPCSVAYMQFPITIPMLGVRGTY
jgi:hypothetical protein